MKEEFCVPSENVKRDHVLNLLTVIEGTVSQMEVQGRIKAGEVQTLRLACKFFKQEL